MLFPKSVIRGIRRMVLGFLAVPMLGNGQTPTANNILVKDGQKVVFMGDSITGMGWGETGGYIHLVVTGLKVLGVNITPVPAGVGGDQSKGMLARLDKDVLSVKPDWLLLSCGVNDVWGRQITLDMFKANITSIVDQAQAHGIKVMILTPTPIYELAQTEFSRLSDYVAFMVQLAHDRKLPLVDENAAYFAYLKTQPPDPANNILTIDGVHPNPDGHQILAQTVLEAFGATPDQMTQIKAAWMALPDGANLPIGFGAHGEVEIKPAQDTALEAMAVEKKLPMSVLVRGLFMAPLRDAMVAHGNLDGYGEDNLSHDAQALFAAKIAEVAPASATPGNNAPAVAHGDEGGFSAVILPDGNVKLSMSVGFRSPNMGEDSPGRTALISIPQYDKFKEIAQERKLSKHALTLSLFMQAIRDELVAHGDLSNVHQDNISHDSWPLYDKNVSSLVK